MELKGIYKYRFTFFCTLTLFALSFIACLMVVFRKILVGNAWYAFLIWNLFLSWVPFGISLLINYIYTKNPVRGKPLIMVILGGLWLLFYPNAPYMITDFIHFKSYGSFFVWYDLVVFSLFIWTSFLLGYISIFLVYRVIETKYNRLFGWLFVLAVLFLSSFGVYLGRFVRWNSWDIISNPKGLIRSIVYNIRIQSLIFTILFGTLLTLTYGFLYFLTYMGQEKLKYEVHR